MIGSPAAILRTLSPGFRLNRNHGSKNRCRMSVASLNRAGSALFGRIAGRARHLTGVCNTRSAEQVGPNLWGYFR